MHIYIDESGSFTIPKKPGSSISCAGALVLLERSHGQVLADFKHLSRGWKTENGEIKGKLLNEDQIDETIQLVRDSGGLFDCVALDVGLHRASEVIVHKEKQAANMMKHRLSKRLDGFRGP